MGVTEELVAEPSGTTRLTIRWRALKTVILTWGVTACLVLAWVQGPTLDEAAHLAAGVYTWRTGQFDVYRVNSPLPRQVATLPLLIAIDEIVFQKQDPDYDLVRPEFRMGRQLIREVGVAKLR